LHTFLPPVSDVETFKTLSIITTKPDARQRNLSTSVFFIRVSGDSLRMLIEAMAYLYPVLPPQQSETDFTKALQVFLELD
jgi:hypothetical protein